MTPVMGFISPFIVTVWSSIAYKVC